MRDLHPIEAAIVAAMLTAEALVAIVRLLVVPLLALVVVLLTPRRPAPQPAPVAAQPVLPAVTLATIAAELQALPAAELRQITGTRRKVAKDCMVAAWLAMPI